MSSRKGKPRPVYKAEFKKQVAAFHNANGRAAAIKRFPHITPSTINRWAKEPEGYFDADIEEEKAHRQDIFTCELVPAESEYTPAQPAHPPTVHASRHTEEYKREVADHYRRYGKKQTEAMYPDIPYQTIWNWANPEKVYEKRVKHEGGTSKKISAKKQQKVQRKMKRKILKRAYKKLTADYEAVPLREGEREPIATTPVTSDRIQTYLACAKAIQNILDGLKDTKETNT